MANKPGHPEAGESAPRDLSIAMLVTQSKVDGRLGIAAASCASRTASALETDVYSSSSFQVYLGDPTSN